MKKIFLLIGTLLFVTCAAFGYTMPRWGMTAIDVYIPAESAYTGTIQRAFQTWAQATGGKIRFRFNNTRFASRNAPIKVEILNEKAPYYTVTSKRHETTGYFMDMEDGFINRAEIKIYSITRHDEPPKQDELYSALLSEIGYILGLDKVYGNCYQGDQKTIMCQMELGTQKELTQKDLDAIRAKYNRTSNEKKEN